MVVNAHDDLPPQLQKIAGFVLDFPEQAALMTIAEISEKIAVQPSAVIRFSKSLGFSGFSDIQKILRQQLQSLIPASYAARLEVQGPASGQLARVTALAEASLSSLPNEAEIKAAAKDMNAARLIHIVGMRRAFGMASYAAYLLAAFDAPFYQYTHTGDLPEGGLNVIGPEDALLAISFPNYRSPTIDIVNAAHRAGATIISVTDSALSPIAKPAKHTLITDQQADVGFRSAVGSMVTIQALAMEYGQLQR